MPMLLMVVGFGWAFIGAANVVMSFGNTQNETALAFGLILNMALFVLPGLAIGGLGYHIAGKRKKQQSTAATEDQRIAAAVAAALAVERAKTPPTA